MMDILSEKIVTTRKEHQCMGCLRIIPAGSKMYRQTNVFDEIGTFKLCLTCNELMDYIEPDDDAYNQQFVCEEMDGEKFTGTPEEFLEYLKQLKAAAKQRSST